MKRKLILCGNGGLLRYVREKIQEDNNIEVVHAIEDINLLSAEKFRDPCGTYLQPEMQRLYAFL